MTAIPALPMMPPIPRHIIIKLEDDKYDTNEISSNGADSNNTEPSFSKNLPLVDEIDLMQCLIFPSQPSRASAIQGVVIGKKHLEVICNATGRGTVWGGAAGSNNARNGFQACPCCRRFIRRDTPEDIECGDDAAMKSPLTNASSEQNALSHHDGIATSSQPEKEQGATLTSLVQAAVTTLTLQPSLMEPMEAPPLVSGDRLKNYTIAETIVQGWLYKKGTGGDFSGRRWWKPRWVTLALAESSDTIIPTPILLSHRAPGVPYPANIIELTESTVIMAIERTHGDTITTSRGKGGEKQPNHQPEEWNRHCLQIVHTQHQDNETTPRTTTRIFTAPTIERNEWVFAMNNALLSYEKRLAKARSDAAKHECRTANKQSSKTRRMGVESSMMMCVEVVMMEEETKEQREPEPRRQLWTDNGGGNSRMRSPSPVRARASMGLPPTTPRPMKSVASPMNSFPMSVTP